ncbi:hypothetical protein FRC12_010318 [Ceratobasidium sp. 428]|nr:hypothetical protein FRC12_010318 [Ceratobasidium sp. 428]
MSNSNTASAATSGALSSAGVLAHMADRAAQEHGLSGDARQQLYTYIIQCSPSIDLLWAYAAALRSTATSEAAIEKVNELFTKIDTLLKMVHQEYQPSKTQGTMVKKLMRRYTVTTKTGYDTLVERTKKYISQHPTQLSLELYNTDSTVKSVVNKFIQHESYQCRGTFRKAIFNEVLGGRVIADASNRICNLLSAGVSDPPPRYIQAHIAQLRLIARERINSIRETEAFVAAQAANNGTTIATSHRPRSDTLFWEVVNARFKELVAHNTIIYDGNPGWTQWEDEVLAADAALFTGQTEFPGENGDDFMGDGGDGGEE